MIKRNAVLPPEVAVKGIGLILEIYNIFAIILLGSSNA